MEPVVDLRADRSRVSTAGVILRYRDRFVFQTGFNRTRSALGVVRLGGHVEQGESPELCALREVREEAVVGCDLLAVPGTWLYCSEELRPSFTKVEWPREGPTPLMAGWLQGDNDLFEIGVTYLAATSEAPKPASETQALVFLTADDVATIVGQSITLGEFLNGGGEAVLAADLPGSLTLHPHQQLVVLARLIADALL